MSACDSCKQPGACCHGIHLNGGGGRVSFWANEPRLAVLTRMAELWLPFVPTEEATRNTDPESDKEFVTYLYDCTMLGPDGRCTIYEDRPQLCRDYQPKSDALCVMYEEAA